MLHTSYICVGDRRVQSTYLHKYAYVSIGTNSYTQAYIHIHKHTLKQIMKKINRHMLTSINQFDLIVYQERCNVVTRYIVTKE